MNKKLAIYQAKNGAIELKTDSKADTIWANQKQIANIFNKDQSVISRHIKNILSDEEVEEKSNMQKMHIANFDKPVLYYSLDIILSVGYRANLSKAIDFRKWATKTLKQHITNGYTINPKRIEKNYQAFIKAVDDVKLLAKNNIKTDDALEIVKSFAQEKNKDSLAGIFASISQSAFRDKMYQSITEKVKHLLYFIVKNHPFNDDNKRSGAFSFIWFLNKANFDFKDKITPGTLTTLTLLIATSNPSEKDKLIGLVLLLLKK
jgi:prophage antirepressor-like protein